MKSVKPILQFKDHGNMHIINPYKTSGDNPNAFIMEINTQGTSQFVLPLRTGFTYNCTVDWGDGQTSTITAYNDPDITHNYASDGVYVVQIIGTFQTIYFNNGTQKLKLIKILHWGDIGLTHLEYSFYGCSNLTTLPIGSITGGSAIITFYAAFQNCTSLSSIPVGLFDYCPNVTSFSQCFYGCTSLLSIPAGLFDYCPNVTTFSGLFYLCTGLTGAIPSGFFANCQNVTIYTTAFLGCRNLIQNVNIFDLASLYKVTAFTLCFYRMSTSYSDTGTTADIWNYATHPSLVKTQCFYNNTTLSNYADIPADWK